MYSALVTPSLARIRFKSLRLFFKSYFRRKASPPAQVSSRSIICVCGTITWVRDQKTVTHGLLCVWSFLLRSLRVILDRPGAPFLIKMFWMSIYWNTMYGNLAYETEEQKYAHHETRLLISIAVKYKAPEGKCQFKNWPHRTIVKWQGQRSRTRVIISCNAARKTRIASHNVWYHRERDRGSQQNAKNDKTRHTNVSVDDDIFRLWGLLRFQTITGYNEPFIAVQSVTQCIFWFMII